MDENPLLITSIGESTDHYKKANYKFNGDGETTKFAPIATAELVEDDINEVLIAHTKSSKDAAGVLKNEFEDRDFTAHKESIPTPESQSEIDDLMTSLIAAIEKRDPSRLIVDVTFGFRTLPMVIFTTIAHLETVNGIEIAGIYYGKLETEGDGGSLIDITYLNSLYEWYHALNAFERTGEMRPVHAILEKNVNDLVKNSSEIEQQRVTAFVDRVGDVSENHDEGLPLYSAIPAREATELIETIDKSAFIGPSSLYLESLEEMLALHATGSDAENWSNISLNEDEMQREAEIIEYYTEKGQFRLALECAKELYINCVLNYSDKGVENWLANGDKSDDDFRGTWSKKCLKSNHIDGIEEESIKTQFDNWQEMNNIRNHFSHNGYNREEKPDPDHIRDRLLQFCETVKSDDYWSEIVNEK